MNYDPRKMQISDPPSLEIALFALLQNVLHLLKVTLNSISTNYYFISYTSGQLVVWYTISGPFRGRS